MDQVEGSVTSSMLGDKPGIYCHWVELRNPLLHLRQAVHLLVKHEIFRIYIFVHYCSNEAAYQEDRATTTPYRSVQQQTLSIFKTNAAFCELYLSKKITCCNTMIYMEK